MRLIPSVILLLGVCCISTGAIAQTQTTNSKQQLKDDPVMYLTGGYSSDQQMAAVNQCLSVDSADFSYQGSPQYVMDLDPTKDFNQFQKDLNVNVVTSGRYGMFANNANANYARTLEGDNYTELFYHDETIFMPTKVYMSQAFGLNSLNTFGQEMEQADSTGQTFRTYCGDQYVAQTPLGEQLFVTIKVDFANRHDRVLFDANVGPGVTSLNDTINAIQAVVNRYGLQGELEIYGLQEGGDGAQLTKVFGSGAICGGANCVKTCNLNNLSDCQETINSVFNYALNNLPSQVSYKDGQIIGNAVPLSYTMGAYLGVKVGQTLVTDAVEKVRVILGNTYSQLLQQNTFLSHVLSSSQIAPYLSANYRQQIQTINQSLVDNLNILQYPNDGVTACYQAPDQCLNVYNNIISRLVPMSEQDQVLYNQLVSAYLAEDETGNYYVIPLGGYQYETFDSNMQQATAYQTATPNNDGLEIDGTDKDSQHFSGELLTQQGGGYKGTITYDNGEKKLQTWKIIDNPV